MELHIKPLSIEGSERVAVVNTQFNTAFPAKMKEIKGSRWTPEHNCWHIPYTREAWTKFQEVFEGHTIIRDVSSNEVITEAAITDGMTARHPVSIAINTDTTNADSENFDAITDGATARHPVSTEATQKVIARRCIEQPDRVFLSILEDRKDWIIYIAQTKGQAWHSAENLWSVPRTKELHQQFADYFGDALVIDKKNLITLTDADTTPLLENVDRGSENFKNSLNVKITNVEKTTPFQNLPPQYKRFTDKLTVFDHPTKQDFWCLNLPKLLVPTHLQTVKNIQGRAWNDAWFVWDIPKTMLSQHFLDTYLPNLVHWDCERKTEATKAEALPIIKQVDIVAKKTAAIKQNTPIVENTVINTAQFDSFPTEEYATHQAKNWQKSDNNVLESHTPDANNARKVVVRLAPFWRGKLSVVVPYNLTWIEKIKQMSGKQWHKDHKCWTLPYSPFTIETLEKNFGDHLDIDLSDPQQPTPHSAAAHSLPQTTPTNTPTLIQTSKPPQLANKQLPTDWTNKFVFVPTPNDSQQTTPQQPFNPTSNLTIDRRQQPNTFDIETPQYKTEITKLEEKMTMKRMAHETIKLYKNCFGQFIKHYDSLHPENITKDQIIKYMVGRIQTGNFSETQQNNFISAIKCYYELVLGRERTYYDLQRPKMPFHLPNILSENETIKLFNAVTNIKHRCILLAIYSSGIRLSELTNLRIQDLREADNCMFIKGGKGRKDRLTLLSPILLEQLKPYLAEYTPNYWLFEGQTGGKYSNRSVQEILRKAVDKSGVNPFATVHTLRHSFATHLVLGGENLITVQHLLGHEDLRTTEIYIHLTGEFIRNTKSPLDRLKF